jgi:hypothetical protein
MMPLPRIPPPARNLRASSPLPPHAVRLRGLQIAPMSIPIHVDDVILRPATLKPRAHPAPAGRRIYRIGASDRRPVPTEGFLGRPATNRAVRR